MYVIIEMGTSCYKYSWYGPNIFVSNCTTFLDINMLLGMKLLNVLHCIYLSSNMISFMSDL